MATRSGGLPDSTPRRVLVTMVVSSGTSISSMVTLGKSLAQIEW